MIIPESNQISYGKKSLRIYGPKLWNSVPYHIKSSENLEYFKRTIKYWNGQRLNLISLFKLSLFISLVSPFA